MDMNTEAGKAKALMALSALERSMHPGQAPVRSWDAIVRRAIQFTSSGTPGGKLTTAYFNQVGNMTVRELFSGACAADEDANTSDTPRHR